MKSSTGCSGIIFQNRFGIFSTKAAGPARIGTEGLRPDWTARVLRDPYSAKPYVLFYTTKRVGGGVQDFDAIKLLKFAA
jgi:hypothetical protein